MEKLNDKWFRIIGIPVLGIIIPTIFFVIGESETEIIIKIYAYSLFIAILIWEVGRFWVKKIRQRFPRIEQVYKRFLLTVSANILSVACIGFSTNYIIDKTYYFHRPLTTSDYMENTGVPIAFIITLTVIYEGLYLFKKWKQTWLENLYLKREKMQAQVDSLKTQVSPHFLFHALDSLSLLVDEDTDKAVNFVDELSSVYRYFLQNHEKETITLEEEMRFATAYFDIIKTRFGEGIHFKTAIADNLKEWLVPPMTIKTCVENAVSLNKVAISTPLSIFFYTDLKNNLVINHNVQSKVLLLKRKRSALINLTTKYKMLTHSDIEISENDKEFEVKLPLLKP